MGASGCADALPVLEEYLSDPNDAVRETCELAVARLRFQEHQQEGV